MLTRDDVVNLLATNDQAVGRALVALNKRQTQDEQQTQVTRHDNGRGFKPCHARMGTSMAQGFQRFGRLTPKQVAYWRRTNRKGVMRIACYWRQLLEIAQEKAAATTTTTVRVASVQPTVTVDLERPIISCTTPAVLTDYGTLRIDMQDEVLDAEQILEDFWAGASLTDAEQAELDRWVMTH